MKKQILSEELKRMKRLAGIITESQYNKLIEENYSVQNFITDFSTAEFFKPFLQAVVTDKNNVGLDMNKPEDWTKIMSMDRKQLQDTFGLTMGTAMKLYNALQPKINTTNQANDFNTVDGRAARLNDFFKQGGTSGDYAEFKAMNDHFMKGGEIENLEPKLKNIYMSKYKPFTKEEFMEIFKKVNINENLEENGGFDIEKTKQPVDLSQYDLEPLRQKFLRMHGEIPTDEELRNIISAMNLEEAQDSEDVMIQEGQLGKAIARMLFEEMLKEEDEEYDITDVDEIDGKYCKDFEVRELKPGDIIYRRLIDVDDNEIQWARDVNSFEPFGLAVQYSSPISFEVVEVGDNTIKLK